MDVGGGPDNAGGRGLVSGGGPIPSPRVAPPFMTVRFCVRGRIGRPLPASAIVGSLDGGPGSYSSSITVLRLRDVVWGRDEENEAGILVVHRGRVGRRDSQTRRSRDYNTVTVVS